MSFLSHLLIILILFNLTLYLDLLLVAGSHPAKDETSLFNLYFQIVLFRQVLF